MILLFVGLIVGIYTTNVLCNLFNIQSFHPFGRMNSNPDSNLDQVLTLGTGAVVGLILTLLAFYK